MITGLSTTRRALNIGAFLLLLSATVAIRAAIPMWAPTGNMTVARMGGLPFLLADGRVLVVGGTSTGGAAALFDPSTGTWSAGPSSASEHPQLPAGVRLSDGRILISGGRHDSGVTVAGADIYNPSTNAWTPTGAMRRSRVGHTLTLLGDGRALATGGYSSETYFEETAEIYNPATETWAFTASMAHGKWLHTAALLNDGRVLVAGGEHYTDPLGPHFRITEYYNPATATWTAGPSLMVGRAAHAAAFLPDGRLLVAGGVNGWLLNSPQSSTEIFDGSSWLLGPPMAQPRLHFPLIVMSDGALLATGGTSYNSTSSTVIAGAERYDAATNAWMPSGVMNAPRRFHSAIQLADGRVLVAGGQDGANLMASSEIMSGDPVAPETTATRSLAPNGNGWNNGDVTIALAAADDAGGSGVQSIVYALTGAQTGGATVSGAMASVVISAEGTSTLAYHAKDVAGNVEADQTLLVRIDRTAPILASQPNVTAPATAGGTVIAFNPSATDGLSGVVSVSSAPLSSGMRFPAGTTTVQLTALDAAGNAATTSFTVTIVPSAPIVTVTGGDFVADGNTHPATAIARDSTGAAVAGAVNFAYAPGGASAPSAPGYYSAAATFISSDSGILSAFPWTTRARDPRSNTGPTVVALNGKLYVHGFDSDSAGNQSSFVPRLSIYDPASNSWTIGASPGLIRAGVSMGVINGKIYVAGGCIMSDCRIGITNALEIYDPIANSWSNGAPMATGRLGAATGVIGGRLYVTGGTLACPPCAPTSVTESYNPVTNTWTPGAPIPVPHENPASGVVNGLLYVIGGYERNPANTLGGAPGGRVDVYDPASNSWTTRTPMPTARYAAAAGVINGTIHVAGGRATTLLVTNESYDPQRDTWASGPPMLTARTASAGVVDSKLYVMGGNPRGTTEAFDPSLTARITISAPLNRAPLANAGGPYFADEGAAVTLNGSGSSDADAGDSIVHYSWSIDNGPPVSGVNPTVTVVGVGFHDVSVTVTDAFGATSTASTTLLLYHNVPTASLSANPNPAACHQIVSLDGSASSVGRPDRSIVSYAWNFGDGTPVVSGSASSASHVYGQFGFYTATLTVTDNNVPAKTAATSLLVSVNQGNQPPTANHGGPYMVDLGDSVQLNGAVSSDPDTDCGDSIVSYAWTIDGTLVLNGVSPILTAAQINVLGTGPHNISLTVTDEFGVNGSASTTMSIYNNVPTALFTANPNPVACNQLVSFNGFGSSAGRPDRQVVQYAWNFGDGTTQIIGGTSSLNYGYTAFGSYMVTLTVTDNNMPPKSATTSAVVAVSAGNQPPQANPGGPYSVNAGSSVQLNGAGSSDPNAGCGDSIVSYAWTIDGTIQLSGPTPMLDTAANSLTAGSHSVSLSVTDEFGVSGTSSTTLNVQPVIVSVSVSPATASLSPGQNQTFQAVGHYSDGTTRMLPSGGGGGNGGGTFGPNKPRWSVNFTPSMINVSACATAQSPAPINFSSQTIVDTNGTVHETWSPGTPVITVDGSINAATVALTLLCTTSPVSGTITAQWTGTKYEGTFSFNGGASTGRVELTGWSQHAPMPVARFSLAAAASGGLVYAIGGIGTDAWSSSVDAYNPATNSWTTVGQMATPRTGAGAVTINGKIYVVGGHVAGGIASGIIEAYNPSSNTWDTALTPMPTPRAHLAVVTDGVNVYAIGGDTSGNNGGAVSTVEQYDPSLNSWSTLASMPSPGNFIVAGVLNGAIIVAGSGGSGGPSSATDIYEIATGTWRAGPPMPAGRTLAAAGVANGGLYVVGGTVNGSPAYDAWVFYPATNWRPEGWAGVGPMLIGRSQLAAAVVNGVVYALGGMVPGANPNLPVAANETLSTPPVNTYAVGGGPVNGGGNQALPTVQWQSTNSFVSGVDASGSARANALGQTTIVAVLSNGMSCVSSSTCAILTVVDTMPPFLNLPGNQNKQATGPTGAVVTYFASANDSLDGARPVTCNPASNSPFPFGPTAVNCSASDLSGNTATGSFVITVVDTTAPFMSTPSGNQTRQATSAAGALVTYTATANDSVDGPRPVTCNPPSGSPFPFGPTPVTCSASDTRGNTATRTFTIIVQDTIAPFLNVPFQPFNGDATSAAGAVVVFVGGAVSAFDGVDGAITPSCTPSSGSTFRIGSTNVTCQATDAHGNQSLVKSFMVIVVDRPVVSVPADIVAEATSAAGALVPFTATASSFADGALPVQCFIITGFSGGEPQFGAPVASGAAFPLGATTVGCLATSSTNSTEGDLFSITVVDTTAPVLALPPGVIANATSVTGAVVAFSASAKDLVGGARPVVCSPPAGSAFVIGVTTVSCTSADALGNSATGAFTVTVLGASQIVSGISAEILVIDFQQSINLLQNVVTSINAGNTGAACGQLAAFINQVQAAAGKKLTRAEADGLIKMATDAKGAIGCP